MTNASKQDVQNVVDAAKNRILERVLTRQDLQSISDASRNRLLTYMQVLQQQNFQAMKQSRAEYENLSARTVALESHLVTLQQQLRETNQLLTRVLEQSEQRIVMPIQPESAQTPEQRYLYRPA